jgi:hypothetical protein
MLEDNAKVNAVPIRVKHFLFIITKTSTPEHNTCPLNQRIVMIKSA